MKADEMIARYAHAVAQRLPQAMRDDVSAELKSSVDRRARGEICRRNARRGGRPHLAGQFWPAGCHGVELSQTRTSD